MKKKITIRRFRHVLCGRGRQRPTGRGSQRSRRQKSNRDAANHRAFSVDTPARWLARTSVPRGSAGSGRLARCRCVRCPFPVRAARRRLPGCARETRRAGTEDGAGLTYRRARANAPAGSPETGSGLRPVAVRRTPAAHRRCRAGSSVFLIRPRPQVGRNEWWAATGTAGVEFVVLMAVFAGWPGGGFRGGVGTPAGPASRTPDKRRLRRGGEVSGRGRLDARAAALGRANCFQAARLCDQVARAPARCRRSPSGRSPAHYE